MDSARCDLLLLALALVPVGACDKGGSGSGGPGGSSSAPSSLLSVEGGLATPNASASSSATPPASASATGWSGTLKGTPNGSGEWVITVSNCGASAEGPWTGHFSMHAANGPVKLDGASTKWSPMTFPKGNWQTAIPTRISIQMKGSGTPVKMDMVVDTDLTVELDKDVTKLILKDKNATGKVAATGPGGENVNWTGSGKRGDPVEIPLRRGCP